MFINVSFPEHEFVMWLHQEQFLYLEDIYAGIFRDKILADNSQMVQRVFGVYMLMNR